MASVIKIKRSSVPSKVPTTSDIATGELAINTKDRKIYSSNGTVVFSFTSDYIQVANAVSLYATKANPTTSGLLAHTGRATISTNLTVSGNTVIGKLVANGSLGSSGYALKSNGSTVYWDAVGSSSGTVVSLTTATVKDLTQNDTVVTAVSVGTASSYLQVANAVSTYQTKAVERAALANTNLAITNVKTGLTTTNTALRTIISDRLQVANAAVIYQTKAIERAALANTNLRINLINTNLTGTNTAIRTLVSDRLQVANAVSTYQTKAVERAALANTNLAITNVKTGLTTTNTALRTLISDRLQVANAVATYATKANPTTSGLLAHTGRATISTNLTVSGNTVIGKLVANNSLGTAGYALKSNGSTVYWDNVDNRGIVLNNTTISANYTIPAGVNGFSVGPITVSGGYAVTVTSGQRWLVL